MAWGHGELQGEFSAKRGQLFVADDAAHSAQMNAVYREELEQNLFGLKSGLRESLIETGAIAAADAQQALVDDADRKSKERADDMLLLALINAGDLEAYIAKQVFGEMNAEQIAEVVARIEEQTGMTFEEYARDVLGDEYEPRKDGETELEYQKRILEAVTAKVLDGKEIRPEYANDPVAQILKEHNLEALGREFAAKKDAQIAAQGGVVTENDIQDVESEAGEGYGTADVLGNELQTSQLSGVGTDVQDGSRDVATSQNTNAFGALFNAASMGVTAEAEKAPSPEEPIKTASLPSPGVG